MDNVIDTVKEKLATLRVKLDQIPAFHQAEVSFLSKLTNMRNDSIVSRCGTVLFYDVESSFVTNTLL